MKYFKINGREYDVIVEGLTEEYTILYGENTGRTLGEGCPMILDALGTFFSHKVTVSRKAGKEAEFDELYRLLSRPRNKGLNFDVVHNQDVAQYEGYVSKGSRAVKRIDEKTGAVYWDKMTVNIAPIKAQVTIDDGESSNTIW